MLHMTRASPIIPTHWVICHTVKTSEYNIYLMISTILKGLNEHIKILLGQHLILVPSEYGVLPPDHDIQFLTPYVSYIRELTQKIHTPIYTKGLTDGLNGRPGKKILALWGAVTTTQFATIWQEMQQQHKWQLLLNKNCYTLTAKQNKATLFWVKCNASKKHDFDRGHPVVFISNNDFIQYSLLTQLI